MGDYYDILGISKNAEQNEIKNAYRKLAREHHPDKGGNKEQFQKIQEAYEILSDPEKRQNYDNPMPSFSSSGHPFDFNLNTFFNQHVNRMQRKNDHFYNCKITLNDVYFGTKKTIKISREIFCHDCNSKCKICNGTGIIARHIQMGPFTQVTQSTCNNCRGSGKTISKNNTCNKCDENCKIKEEKIVDIIIERGCPVDKRIIIEGWGEQADRENQISGNLVISIVCQETIFKRDDLNLLYEIQLSLAESIIGKEVCIPHYDGELNIDTRMFGVINPNNKYYIADKGLVNTSGVKGNLIILFKVIYPNLKINDNAKKLLKNVFSEVGLK